jgi:hypothetical protein
MIYSINPIFTPNMALWVLVRFPNIPFPPHKHGNLVFGSRSFTVPPAAFSLDLT